MRPKVKFTATNGRMRTIQAHFATVVTLMLCLVLSGCHKENLGETSGEITYNSSVYTVSIGEIGKDDSGNLRIELTGNLAGEVSFVQGKIVPYIGMRIVVDGKTMDYDSGSIQAGLYVYYFKTSKNPEKIIVYSNDGRNSTLTFHGKRKTVIK